MSDGLVTVKVPFSERQVEVDAVAWQGCRRMENGVSVLALLSAAGMFAGGLELAWLQPAAGLLAIVTVWFYFDGVLARWCAVRKARG